MRKSPLRTCLACKDKFEYVGREEVCSPECRAAYRDKRRQYFRDRYLAKTQGIARRRPLPVGRPQGDPYADQDLVTKVAHHWRVPNSIARQWIDKGTFPP